MKILKIDDIKALDRKDLTMKTVFEENGKFSMGTVVIPPGTRAPKVGAGAHEDDEYSIILKGSLKTMSGDKEYTVKAGEATFIPAGEAHWALNESDTDCELVWMMLK